MARTTRPRQPTAGKREAQGRRLTYTALAELFQQKGPRQKVAGTSAYTLDHLRRFFGRRLPESSTIVDYVRWRQKEDASIQTINEELWSLAWMFRCAVQRGKIAQEDCPRIEFLRDAATVPAHRLRVRPEPWFSRAKPPEPAAVPAAPAPPKARGKLSPKALAEHIKQVPLDKRNADGTHFSVNQRLPLLKKEGIEINRSWLTRRLNDFKNALK